MYSIPADFLYVMSCDWLYQIKMFQNKENVCNHFPGVWLSIHAIRKTSPEKDCRMAFLCRSAAPMRCYAHPTRRSLSKAWHDWVFSEILSAVNKEAGRTRGRRILPQNPSSKKRPKWCSGASIEVIGKSALDIGQFLRRNFWMISGGPFLWPQQPRSSQTYCNTNDKPTAI